MNKLQIVLVGGAVLVAVALYSLPKVIVKNNDKETVELLDAQKTEQMHTSELSEVDSKQLDSLSSLYNKATSKEAKARWADSLLSFFLEKQGLDSATKYAEILVGLFATENNYLKAGNTYFLAFNFSIDSTRINATSKKALAYYEKVIAANPENYEAQVKSGVIYKIINPQAPMQGIKMVADVARKDPNNELALFYMGLFFLERGAHQESIEKLEKLVSIHASNADAWLLLAENYQKTQQNNKAIQALEKAKTLVTDPAILAQIETGLRQLK